MNIPRINLTLGLTKGGRRMVNSNIFDGENYIDYTDKVKYTDGKVVVIYGGLTFAVFTYDRSLGSFKVQ